MIYLFVCLVFIKYIFDNFLIVLNINHFLKIIKGTYSLPEILKKEYTKEKLLKTYDYIKKSYKLNFFSEIPSMILMLVIILSGIYQKLYFYIFNHYTKSEIYLHLILVLTLAFISYILNLPFQLYRDFILEKKFNFSTIKFRTFIKDQILGLLLFLVLIMPLLSLIFYFVVSYKSTWHIFSWITVTLFSLFISKIFPTFIAPLFNKYKPLDDSDLILKIKEMAEKIGFNITKILVEDTSKRSKHSNAYFTGFGKNKQIVLSDTILKQLDADELIVVIAHELGHFKKKHIWKILFIQNVFVLSILFLVKYFSENTLFLTSFHLVNLSYISKMFYSIAFIQTFIWILDVPLYSMLRKFEFEADAFSKKTTNMPEKLSSSLIKLTKENLSNPLPHPLYSKVNYSHPPLIERINSLEK